MPAPSRRYAYDLAVSRVVQQMESVRRNVYWLLLQRGTELLFRFVVGAWLVRYLGPEEFGNYAYAVNFVALFLDASLLGLDQIVVRELARSPKQAGEILSTAIGLRLAAAFSGFTLACWIAVACETNDSTSMAIVVLAGQLWFNPVLVLDLWFQSRVQARYAVWTRTAATVMVSVVQVAFILAAKPLEAFFWLVVLQSLLSSIGAVLVFMAVGPRRLSWAVSWPAAREMLRNAWPLLVSAISISAYMRIDQVMLKQMAGATSVGTYAAAVKLSELWYALPTALAISVFPKIVAMRASGQDKEYIAKLRTICDLLALYSYVVVAGVWILAPALIHVLFGPAYSSSVPILRVHVVALLFVALGVIYTRWLTVEERTTLVMVSTCIGAVLNIALNLALIPAFGPLGAAWATVIAYAAATFAVPVLIPELRPVRRVLFRALAAPARTRPLLREISGLSWRRAGR